MKNIVNKGFKFITFLINKVIGIKKINIGGGPSFFGLNWINLDAVDSIGSSKILFSEHSVFPYADNTIDFVYSSHCLEHLDDGTVSQLLKESHRVLKKDGKILIKIPDFDGIRSEYRKQNFHFIKNLGQDSVFWTWSAYNVAINLENCYSMMVCGYWNHEYGDHFSSQINKGDSKAYHGPVRLPQAELVSILDNDDVREISKTLNKYALDDKNFKQFNHQNAWSFEQFKNLLTEHEYSIIEMNKKNILKNHKDIPYIETMADWSMFILGKK